MNDKVRFVETILPRSHLYELGVYLQTCAQIEFYACSSVCKIEKLTAANPAWRKRHDELRNLSVSDLITALSKAAKTNQVDDPWKTYFIEITAWLHRFVDNRHVATHGRHFTTHESDFVSIDVALRNSRTDRIIVANPNDVGEAVSDADNILRTLIRYCEAG